MLMVECIPHLTSWTAHRTRSYSLNVEYDINYKEWFGTVQLNFIAVGKPKAEFIKITSRSDVEVLTNTIKRML